MKKIIVLSIFCFLFVTNKGYSQQSYYNIAYSVGISSGDLSDYISAPSFRGINFEYRGYLTNNIAAGVEVGWSLFYDSKDYDTYTSGTKSLSGYQYRYSHHIPILATADYMIKPGDRFNPYIGLGFGTMYSERKTVMGMFDVKENAWHLALRPEIGALFEMNRSVDLKFGVKYLTGFKAGDLEKQSYFTLNFGFVFKQY